ncbi:hypothetical protein [Luteibacter sp.]|uniref:hypothetical protein n=1 Tax=Luteibacter sp. TaxID=1886636 RepID=UPI003F81465D
MLRIKSPFLVLSLACFLTAAVTIAVYAQGLHGGFLFDDFPNIVDNNDVQPTQVSLASLLNAALSSPASEFKRPLASLSFALNIIASDGLDPVAMKVTNVVLHVANGVLLFALLTSLFAWVHGSRRPNDGITALLITAGWLLLPINLTAVLYVVQRMESMANLFVLAGLLGYVSGRRRMLAGRKGLVLAIGSVLLGAVLGVLAKETAVLLPLYALMLEVFLFHGRSVRTIDAAPTLDRRIFIFYLVFLVVPFIVGAVWLIPKFLNPASWAGRDYTLSTRLWSESRIVVDYVAWTLVPFPSDLSFYHDDFRASTGPLTPWTTILCILVLVAIAWTAVALRKRAPLIGLGLAWYLACHTLTATVLPLELIYEHRNYFASIGLVLVAVCLLRAETGIQGANSVGSNFALARHVALASLLAWWGCLLAVTARAWDNPLTMAQELAWRGPGSPRAQYELGRTYIILSRYDPSSPLVGLAYGPLERAMRIPGSSVLPEQALIFLNARMGRTIDRAWWESMRGKLASRKPTVQDESSLEALAKCQASKSCAFPAEDLVPMFLAAMSHPMPTSRLLATYADFAWTNLGDRTLGLAVQEQAVAVAPNEMAYRITLASRLIADDRTQDARAQLAAIRAANVGGRFDADILRLEGQMLRRPGGP